MLGPEWPCGRFDPSSAHEDASFPVFDSFLVETTGPEPLVVSGIAPPVEHRGEDEVPGARCQLLDGPQHDVGHLADPIPDTIW